MVPIPGTLLELWSAKSYLKVIEKPEHKKTRRELGKEEEKVKYTARNGPQCYT